MEVVKYKRKTVWRSEQEFSYETLASGARALVTHQGFAPRLKRELEERGFQVRYVDCCVPDLLPPPRLDLMHGFRNAQEEVTTQLILSNRSGRLALPTRYGKTMCLINILRAYPGVKTVVLAPGADLLEQLTEDLRKALGPEGREVKQIGGGSSTKYMSEDITVCSIDSTHKLDKESVRLLIADEIHAMPSDSRQDILLDFSLCRKFGMTASQTGRYDKKDYMIEGLFGPILAQRTYKEGVAEKAVEQITVMMLDWPMRAVSVNDALSMDRDAAMRSVFQSDLMGRCVSWLANTVVPKEWQTLFFIKTEEQADFMLEYVGRETAIAMAKKLTKKQRREMTERVRQNEINRVICSDIFVQGVTFHDVMCLVNLGGGGASTTTIQKPGRLAEIRPEKYGALLVDFFFRPGNQEAEQSPGIMQMWRESIARMESYKDTGYHTVNIKPSALIYALHGTQIRHKGIGIKPPI